MEEKDKQVWNDTIFILGELFIKDKLCACLRVILMYIRSKQYQDQECEKIKGYRERMRPTQINEERIPHIDPRVRA